MSGITDSAATQAHDIVEQAEAEEQRVQGDHALTGEQKGTTLEGSNTSPGATSGQATEGHGPSKLEKIKGALHLNK